MFLNGAAPYKDETQFVELATFNPNIKIVEEKDGVYLHMALPPTDFEGKHQLVTTELLGKASIPGLPFVNFDGAPLKIDADFFGQTRSGGNPSVGPFERSGEGKVRLKVWPRRMNP